MKKALVFLVLAVLVLTMSSCKIQPKCGKPQFSTLASGLVIIGSQTFGSTIYYTLSDEGGSPPDPDTGSIIYTEPIDIRGKSFPVTIKAQVMKEGYRNSSIATRVFYREDVFFGETNYPDTLNIPVVDTLVTGEPVMP